MLIGVVKSGGLGTGGIQGPVQLGLAAGSGVGVQHATDAGFVNFRDGGFEVSGGLFQVASRERSQRTLRVSFNDLLGDAIVKATLVTLLQSLDRGRGIRHF